MRLSPAIALLCLFFSCGQNKNAHTVLHTSMGDIRVRLFDSTPKHRDNFIFLTENSSAADTLLFYRIERDFAIQFGPPPGGLAHDYIIEQEIEAPILTGALVAVKADSLLFSDGTDFFIVLGRSQTDASLDDIEKKTSTHFSQKERNLYKKHGGLPQMHGQHTVFGQVAEGLDIAHRIAALPRDERGRPLQEVKLWVEIE